MNLRLPFLRPAAAFFALIVAACPSAGAELAAGQEFAAKDTFDPGAETKPDAQACLDGFAWKPADFRVVCESRTGPDALLRFPSPRPSGDAANDSVAMDWMPARDAQGALIKAPAIVVAHESGRGMMAGRLFAASLRAKGFHAFLLHLPGYGKRTSTLTDDYSRMLPAMAQAVADVRRAKDAVAVLPETQGGEVSLLGVSLGGFVTAATAGLDRGYSKQFIFLAGANLAHTLLHGQRDAAHMRAELLARGYTAERITQESRAVEPLRLASRVDPARCWLFSGARDEVVPPVCSREFAEAARLPASHWLEYDMGHYDVGIRLPAIISQMANILNGRHINDGLPAALKLPGGAPPDAQGK